MNKVYVIVYITLLSHKYNVYAIVYIIAFINDRKINKVYIIVYIIDFINNKKINKVHIIVHILLALLVIKSTLLIIKYI